MENISCYTPINHRNKPLFSVFAAGPVGEMAVRMFGGAETQLSFVLLGKENFWNWNDRIKKAAYDIGGTVVYYYENDDDMLSLCIGLDAVILAYWGKLIRRPMLEMLGFGCINLHTSYLPYGKGKHAHYWAIREDAPFGVTIMKIDEGLDTGDIIFQKRIEVKWEDTAKSLYFKALACMEELLFENREDILNLNLYPQKQNGSGSIHFAKELVSKIELDKKYAARELINLIRAKMFLPISLAYFEDEGETYEVEIKIRKSEGKLPIDYVYLYDEEMS